MNALEAARLRAIEAARNISQSLEDQRKKLSPKKNEVLKSKSGEIKQLPQTCAVERMTTKVREELAEKAGLRQTDRKKCENGMKEGILSEIVTESNSIEGVNMLEVYEDLFSIGDNMDESTKHNEKKDDFGQNIEEEGKNNELLAFDSTEIFGDLFLSSDELLDVTIPDDEHFPAELTSAMQMLEAPCLLSTRCFDPEERRKVLAAVASVYNALIAAEDNVNERLDKVLSRATQSQDRVVATAARSARLKVHTKRRWQDASLQESTKCVTEEDPILLRREVERLRNELKTASRKLAVQTEAATSSQRSLRASFAKAQRDWTTQRSTLEREKAQALASASRWEQKAKALAENAECKPKQKAQRRIVNSQMNLSTELSTSSDAMTKGTKRASSSPSSITKRPRPSINVSTKVQTRTLSSK
uniref:Uncharacterized protein n=1 Tax=Aureoumbra lagunensis TaxID=44058 RepID=A0A7S3JYR5_9STRA